MSTRKHIVGNMAREIGEALGVTPETVARHRVAAGVAQTAAARVTPDQWQTAERMLDDGCSLAEIARTIGTSASTVATHYPGRGWTKQEVGQWRAFMRRANRQLAATELKPRQAQHGATEETV